MDKGLVIFFITYVVIAAGSPYPFRIDRTGAAIIGASAMVLFGVVTKEEALSAIDYKTILILFGMMIIIADLRLSGFFTKFLENLIKKVKTPSALLGWLIAICGILSALFVNDTICLIFTPFVLALTRRAELEPKPYLLGLCMASNIGSAATLTGNPQNIIIGSYSHIGYTYFLLRMLVPVALGLLICYAVLGFIYRKSLTKRNITLVAASSRYHRDLAIKSLIVSAITVILFLKGLPMELVALGAGSFLLITRRVNPDKVYRLVDFRLLLLFIGLFIVIAGAEKSPTALYLIGRMKDALLASPFNLIISSAILSNIISNVPAVLLFKPLLLQTDSVKAWLLLSMSTTFAGNLTILGSIANIIVIEGSRPWVKIGFWDYMKPGILITLLTISAGALWLYYF